MLLAVFEGFKDSALSSRMECNFNQSSSGNMTLRKLRSLDAHIAVFGVARLGGFEFDWAGNIGLGGGTKFELVWGQFGSFQIYKLYRLIG